MVEYYKIISGLSLFTTKLQSLFIHTGTGGNGKGILSSIARMCLGDYFITAENTFLTTPYKAGQPNSTLTNARSKRYLFISEPDNGQSDCKFNIDFIKTMTGTDPITTRGLYKDNITYIPQFSPHIQCNHKPKLPKLDNGIYRRVKIIPYRLSFVDKPKAKHERKRDYNLVDRINKQEFINEFMLVMIDKAKEYIDTDISQLYIPPIIQAETTEYLNDNNPVLDWINLNVEQTNNPKDRIKTSDMHKMYNENPLTERHLSATDFCKFMTFNGFVIKKIGGIRYYINCMFKQPENDNDGDFNDNEQLNPLDDNLKLSF